MGNESKRSIVHTHTYAHSHNAGPLHAVWAPYIILSHYSPGTQTWSEGVELVLISGYRLDAPDSVPVPLLSPGQATDLSILLQVPSTPGVYEGRWRLCTRDRRLFGGNSIILSSSSLDQEPLVATRAMRIPMKLSVAYNIPSLSQVYVNFLTHKLMFCSQLTLQSSPTSWIIHEQCIAVYRPPYD